jgi:hypothetical protein
MLTIEQVKYLLALPKKVEADNNLHDVINLDQTIPFQHRYHLVSEQDSEYTFLYNIDQSKKNYFKLSLYLMDNETQIGLLRIDYSGQHQNPPANDNLPPEFQPHIEKFFRYDEPHIHYYVEGYKPLAWAIPLSEIDFEVQQITSNADVISAFIAFNTMISLQTCFIINPTLL